MIAFIPFVPNRCPNCGARDLESESENELGIPTTETHCKRCDTVFTVKVKVHLDKVEVGRKFEA